MRKTINTMALLLFIWLVLDAFDVPQMMLNFLLVGELPGTTVRLSPSTMLAIMTMATAIVIFELLARRFQIFRRIRYQLTHLQNMRERLPKRRFGRA